MARTVANVAPTGTVVLALSGRSDREWAARTALDVCSTWAEAGRRVVVADLHLDTPMLLSGADQATLEGIVDIFLYGASLSRIAIPVREGAFYLIPAGTYAPDVGEIYRHPRWNKLVAGFRDTGATLLLFVPDDIENLKDLAAWSSEALLLGSTDNDSTKDELRRVGIDVLASVPAPFAEASADEADADAESILVGESILDTPLDEDTSLTVGPHGDPLAAPGKAPWTFRVGKETSGADRLDLPPPPIRERSGRRPALLLGGILALVAVVTVVYLLVSLRPDLVPPDAGSVERSGAVGQFVAGGSPGARPEVETLPYSVQVKAFTSLAAAMEQVAIEQRRLPSAPFFVSPEEIQGVLYYKVMAGLAGDTLTAISLRDRLLEVGAIEPDATIASLSLVPYTPLAFVLGEFASREEAMERSDSLLALGIPSYSAIIPYSDGSRRWQLYSGAYRDSAGADRMREILAAAGIPDDLTLRVGAPAPLP